MIKIKTKEDIAILREGGKRHAEIMNKLISIVRPGLKTSEIDEAVRKMIGEKGDKASILDYKPHGATRPYPATICVSINDEVVHGIPNENPRTLEEGDIVGLDFALTHKGLITDMAVTVPVGKISKELEDLLSGTREAMMAGIKTAKGGNKVGDISAAIELIGISKGYGVVEDLAGHGVGYHVHEEPFVPNYGEPGKGEVLKPGTVIAIEPMFNLGSHYVVFDKKDGYTYRTKDGKPSAHFEHTVLITKGDAEILTLV
ncbi:MAG: type I methionyl aminopeptidase [bacterium]|nr:type I methionyl aminopeptidase [bacterium]